MKNLTLSLLFKEGQILLAMKKRGFGEGKWNGYGGKMKEGESIEEAAIREIEEEGNVVVQKEDLESAGKIDFYFSDKPEFNQSVYLFKVTKWQGEPKETDEMRPQWFFLDKIPYESMWAGDDQWLKRVIRGEKVYGEIHFDEEGKKLVLVELRSIFKDGEDTKSEIKMK